ncbi:MAG: hypothetical protein AABY22_08500, partial [Nanoarchaeota archaeon]
CKNCYNEKYGFCDELIKILGSYYDGIHIEEIIELSRGWINPRKVRYYVKELVNEGRIKQKHRKIFLKHNYN